MEQLREDIAVLCIASYGDVEAIVFVSASLLWNAYRCKGMQAHEKRSWMEWRRSPKKQRLARHSCDWLSDLLGTFLVDMRRYDSGRWSKLRRHLLLL